MLAALALGGWMFMQSQSGGSAAPTALTPSPSSAISQANAVAGKLNAHNLATAAGKTDATAAATTKPVAAAVAKPKVHVKVKVTVPATAAVKTAATKHAVAKHVVKPAVVKHVAAKLPNGTPNTIASLLATHAVVVVLLYNPHSKVDYYSLNEAQLGASQANAGFLAVDVLDQRQAAPFTRAYGVLQDPTVMFFVHPGRLVQQLIGFADHETVLQAASNEAVKSGWVQKRVQRRASAVAASADAAIAAWRTKANAVCKANQSLGHQALPANAADARGVVYVRGMERQIGLVVVGLSALQPPATAAGRALTNSFTESLSKMRRDYESFLQARLKNDALTAKTRLVVLKQDDARAKSLAQQIGLTECG